MKSLVGLFPATLLLPPWTMPGKGRNSPQQRRMAECSGKARGLKGGAEKIATINRSLRQEKMASFNARAKVLKGDEFPNVLDNGIKG